MRAKIRTHKGARVVVGTSGTRAACAGAALCY